MDYVVLGIFSKGAIFCGWPKKGTHRGASFLNILRYPGLSAFFWMVQCCRLTENMFPRSDIKTDSFTSKKSPRGPFRNGPLNWTWVSNISHSTYWTGSVGIRSHSLFIFCWGLNSHLFPSGYINSSTQLRKDLQKYLWRRIPYQLRVGWVYPIPNTRS